MSKYSFSKDVCSDGSLTNYWGHLKDSWKELEKRFRNGEFAPQQENDVVCYLYHALISRGIPPKAIFTEDWFSGIGRIDMDVGERLLIEVKLLSRKRTYSARTWQMVVQGLMKNEIQKLTRYVKDLNHPHVRQPVLALFNWESDKSGISEDLQRKLESLRETLSKQGIKLLYGPRKKL